MRTLMQSLLAATAVVTLAPTAAMALPQYCHEVCDEYSSCDQVCVIGLRTIITCGEYSGLCASNQEEPTSVTASTSHEEARTADTQPLVCSNEQQALES